jgi:hypothetical protein
MSLNHWVAVTQCDLVIVFNEATKRHAALLGGALCDGTVHLHHVRPLRVEEAEAILLST